MSKLNFNFFARDARIVAKELLGKILVIKNNNLIFKCLITETEAYIGEIDKACHAYGNKRTAKIEPLYAPPGFTYVYFIYGLYYCFNIITKEVNIPEGVLIRSIEPLNNFDIISNTRFKKNFSDLSKLQIKSLTNGPAKFTMAYKITKEHNLINTLESDILYFEEPTLLHSFSIIQTTRIGIDYAEEAKDFPWRYYIKDNLYISKK